MVNEWFFKWHHIKGIRGVEIDGFDGRYIRLGGIKFSDSARHVYWGAIQRYARQKIAEIFDKIEIEIQKYPEEIRMQALQESCILVWGFVAKIRRQAVDKDRILRGDGVKFPEKQDLGTWSGSLARDIEARADALRHIYCDLPVAKGDVEVPFQKMMTDKVTLVKADGSVFREDIPAQVTAERVITFEQDLPIEPNDHFIRSLPSGLAEDFIVVDPGYHAGFGRIPGHFQSKVHRSDAPTASAQTVIHQITNNFHGPNSRVNIHSIDNSTNTTAISVLEVVKLLDELKAHLYSLPEPHRSDVSATVELLEAEIRSAAPDHSRIRSGLMSIRTVAEGAAGNLVASGIVALISSLLGGS